MDFLKYSNLLTPGNIVLFIIACIAIYFAIKTVQVILRIISLVVFILSSIIFYSTKIEPYQLKIHEHNITLKNTLKQKYAVVSDLHLGHWKKDAWMLRVVNEVNKLDVDAVLFAGDWVSWPITQGILERSLSPLQYLNKPAFAVLGNHDNGHPGFAPFRKNIINELEKNKITILENKVQSLNGVNIIGISDYYSNLDDLNILNNFEPASLEKSIILTHDPDIIMKYPKDYDILTVAGHTHCGQVNIPILKNIAMPTEYKFKNDYQVVSRANNNEVFVSCGVGETLLPIRFLTPPRIDILKL